MAFPKITELVTYINKALSGNAWNTNFQKIVNWLSLGDTDIKVKSLETDSIKYNGNEIFNNGNINANEITAQKVTAGSFVGDGSQLTNINLSNVFAYTPFSVNSAKDNFIDITDTSKLVFLVDDGTLYKPLVATTAEGKTITITSLIDYDVSGLNGTYYVFVDEESNGGTVYLKSCTIFRQQETPTGNNGDIWLDTSNQKYVVREKVSSNWFSDKYNKVPIAKVVIISGVISSLDLLPFNCNGVNVVFDGKYSDVMQRPVVLVKTYKNGSDWYRIWSDGWCEQGGRTTGGASGDYTVTFHQEMADTNYSVSLCPFNTSGSSGQTNNYIKEYSATGMKISLGQPTDFCCWKVEGYI